MAHFYGTVQGNRGEVFRCGTVSSGLTTCAAGWHGAIETVVYFDSELDHDCFVVRLIPWQGSGGEPLELLRGKLESHH